jgi:hypothetical protein
MTTTQQTEQDQAEHYKRLFNKFAEGVIMLYKQALVLKTPEAYRFWNLREENLYKQITENLNETDKKELLRILVIANERAVKVIRK